MQTTCRLPACLPACPKLPSTFACCVCGAKTSLLSARDSQEDAVRKLLNLCQLGECSFPYTHTQAPREKRRSCPCKSAPALISMLHFCGSWSCCCHCCCCCCYRPCCQSCASCCFCPILVHWFCLRLSGWGNVRAPVAVVAAGPRISASLALALSLAWPRLALRSSARSYAHSFASTLVSVFFASPMPINVLFFCSLLLVLNSERAAFGWQHHTSLIRIPAHTHRPDTHTDCRTEAAA